MRCFEVVKLPEMQKAAARQVERVKAHRPFVATRVDGSENIAIEQKQIAFAGISLLGECRLKPVVVCTLGVSAKNEFRNLQVEFVERELMGLTVTFTEIIFVGLPLPRPEYQSAAEMPGNPRAAIAIAGSRRLIGLIIRS
jgi:hypothetical protein